MVIGFDYWVLIVIFIGFVGFVMFLVVGYCKIKI